VGCCQGKCCARFVYPLTPEQLRERWVKWDWNQPHTQRNAEWRRQDLYIADMLIPLSLQDQVDRGEEFDLRDLLDYDGRPMYSCHHWDEATRMCKAYDQRPDMCKHFPYARQCEQPGCTFEGEPYTKVKYAGYAVSDYNPPLMLEEPR
jgi:Fe-S-cluster containining protein